MIKEMIKMLGEFFQVVTVILVMAALIILVADGPGGLSRILHDQYQAIIAPWLQLGSCAMFSGMIPT